MNFYEAKDALKANEDHSINDLTKETQAEVVWVPNSMHIKLGYAKFWVGDVIDACDTWIATGDVPKYRNIYGQDPWLQFGEHVFSKHEAEALSFWLKRFTSPLQFT